MQIQTYALVTCTTLCWLLLTADADPTYEIHTLITGNHSDGGTFYFFTVDPDGNKYYSSDPTSHVIRAADISKGVPNIIAGQAHTPGEADGSKDSALLSHPRGICQSPDGTLWVLDSGNEAIRHVHNGVVTTVVAKGQHPCTDGGSDIGTITSGAWDLICLEDGSLVYTDTQCSKLRMVKCVKHCPVKREGEGALMRGLRNAAGGSSPEFMISTLVAGDHKKGGLFYHLARDNVTHPSGRYYYISDYKNHVVWIADTLTGTSSVLFGVPHTAGFQDGKAPQSLLHTPRGLCQAPDGSVMVLDSGNQAVRRYKDGRVTTVVGNGTHVSGCVDGAPGEGSISNGAWGLICLPDGSMVYSDPNCSELRLMQCVRDCPLHRRKEHGGAGLWHIVGWIFGSVGLLGALIGLAVWQRAFVKRGSAAIAGTREQHTRPAGSTPSLEDLEAPLLNSFNDPGISQDTFMEAPLMGGDNTTSGGANTTQSSTEATAQSATAALGTGHPIDRIARGLSLGQRGGFGSRDPIDDAEVVVKPRHGGTHKAGKRERGGEASLCSTSSGHSRSASDTQRALEELEASFEASQRPVLPVLPARKLPVMSTSQQPPPDVFAELVQTWMASPQAED